MAVPLIVVVLVATVDAHAPETLAMTATTQDVLGPNAIVVVRGVNQLPEDAEAAKLELVLHADAVVEVTWPEVDHRRAHVHVHLSRTDTWSDRDLSFASSDALEERGRSVGFTVASMIPFPSGLPPEPVEPPKPRPGPDIVPPKKPVPEPSMRTPIEVDPVFVATSALGQGSAGAFGGELSARLPLTESFRLRVGVGLRLGDLQMPTIKEKASSFAARLDLGLAWRAWSTGGARPLALGIRADFLVIRHALSLQAADQVSRDARWLPGADAMVELSWAWVPDVALLAGAGAEVAFGTTRVFVAHEQVALIPPARLQLEVGLRIRF